MQRAKPATRPGMRVKQRCPVLSADSHFFVELIIGGVAFYGIIHSVPETPGGPPMARFPWLVWSIAAILCPVGLLLIVHLAGTWLSKRPWTARKTAAGKRRTRTRCRRGMRRFYATVRNAPTLVVLLGILLLGAGLFFVDGAFSALMRLSCAFALYALDLRQFGRLAGNLFFWRMP